MDELIRRKDAIKAVSIPCGTCLARDSKDCEKCSVTKLSELINAIPSVDRQQGEWKAVKASIYPYGYDVKCSVCGFIMGSSYGFKYCPHCGAEMKGEESDE